MSERGLCRSTTSLRSANEHQLAGLAPNGASGVGLRARRSVAGEHAKLGKALEKAGLPRDVVAELLGEGVTPEWAGELHTWLMGDHPSLRTFGPHRLAVELLRNASERCAASSPEDLLADTARYRHVVVVRPDGYLTALLSGNAVQKAGKVEARDDGLYAGGLEVGALYVDHMGVFYRADRELRRVGGPVHELGASTTLGSFLDGIEAGVVGALYGAYRLVTDPRGALEDMAQLPEAVSNLVANFPEERERFLAMSADDQAEALGHLTTAAVLSRGAMSATRAGVRAAGERFAGLELMPPVLVPQAGGAMAVQQVAVSPAAARAVGAVASEATARLAAVQSVSAQVAMARSAGAGGAPPSGAGRASAPPPSGAGPKDLHFDSFEKARNAALAWLEKHGFRADRFVYSRMARDPNLGKPIGMASGRDNVGFRIELDDRVGAHINVWAGKEKGPHFVFPAERGQATVNQIVGRQFSRVGRAERLPPRLTR